MTVPTRKIKKEVIHHHGCHGQVFLMVGVNTVLVCCDRERHQSGEHVGEVRGRTVPGPGGVSLNVDHITVVWKDPIRA